MVRVVFPHLRGLQADTRVEYQHWRTISDRGQRMVQEWSKDPDPNTLGRKLTENYALSETQVPPHLRPRNLAAEEAIGSAATILPAFLLSTAPSGSPARQDNSNLVLQLPLEIRNMVYHELEITREALSVLRSRVLVFDRIPPWIMGHSSPLGICNFINKDALQRVRYLELRVAFGEGGCGSGDIWANVVSDLLRALAPRNSIIELKVLVKLHRVDLLHVWTRELVFYELLLQQLRDWEHKYGNRPCTVHFEHWVIDDPYAYRTGFRNPLIRRHPDPMLWPGSIMEFL
ncbi:hypothetical protein PG987_016208 [Apiospora arundinis]